MSVHTHDEIVRRLPTNDTNVETEKQGSLLDSVRRWLAWIWKVVMVTKESGRYSISQPLALVILAALLAIGGAAFWRSQDQHDQIIRLQTALEIREKSDADRDSKIDQARNFAAVASKDAARLEGRFDQFALDYAVNNAGKKKQQSTPQE